MRSQRIRWSRLAVQKPVRLGEKCASDDNESNRASTTPCSTTAAPLPHDVAAKVLNKAGGNQNYILQESCCRCYMCCEYFCPGDAVQTVELKDVFVHHSDSNSMGLTPSRRCLHI
ncbi:Hypothetical predicted protein [Scomber scombrus]|uniref:4Fe-4S ferredoxin-type domain-containing protein n=1 Tax=Scomber scombrus TaxID=13677 RepID=A0AAV1NGU6_SCOSC